MKHLRGRIALVTGGSRGLGPYIARGLADEGMDVVLVARDAAGLQQAAASVRALGVRAAAVSADLASAPERERLAREAEAALGPIDVLVNNAGVEAEGPFAALDTATIARTVEVNVTAPIHLTRLLLPGMVARQLRATGVGSSVICPGYVTGEGMFARFGVRPPAQSA